MDEHVRKPKTSGMNNFSPFDFRHDHTSYPDIPSNIKNRPPLSTLFSSPSRCKGFTRVSEDSSETVFLLVENYNHDRLFCVFGSEWNFWKKKNLKSSSRAVPSMEG